MRKLMCVFTMFVATSACVRAQEQELKPAPAETVAAYVAAIKKTDQWKLADGLRTEDAVPKLEAWAKEQSVSLNVVQTNFLAELLGIGEARVDAKSKKPMPMEFPPLPGGNNSGIEVPTPMGRMLLSFDNESQRAGLVLTVSKDDVEGARYTVEPEQVAGLAIEHIAAVELLAGSRKPLERFAVRNLSLTEVVEALAHASDLDFVAPRGADTLRITVDLKNVGPREVAWIISEVAGGWSVTISGGGDEAGVFGSSAQSNEPWTAGFADVAKVYANRKLYGLVLPNHPKVETPLDALRQVLSDRMRTQSKGREKIVVTRNTAEPPAAPAQPAPAPKDD